ncbi:hypothetical protein AVEN_193484-1, partial [Araneus ventricosus]
DKSRNFPPTPENADRSDTSRLVASGVIPSVAATREPAERRLYKIVCGFLFFFHSCPLHFDSVSRNVATNDSEEPHLQVLPTAFAKEWNFSLIGHLVPKQVVNYDDDYTGGDSRVMKKLELFYHSAQKLIMMIAGGYTEPLSFNCRLAETRSLLREFVRIQTLKS